MNPLPGAYIQWDESEVSLDVFLRYQVYRREQGVEAWTKVARLTSRAENFYTDYTVEDNTVYEYAVTQVQDVAGDEIESAFPEAVQVTVHIRSLFIHCIAVLGGVYAEFEYSPGGEQTTLDVALVRAWDNPRPTAHIGPGRGRTYHGSSVIPWYDKDVIERAMIDLYDHQEMGHQMMARWYRGKRMFCVIQATSQEYDTGEVSWSIQLTETRYQEEVA